MDGWLNGAYLCVCVCECVRVCVFLFGSWGCPNKYTPWLNSTIFYIILLLGRFRAYFPHNDSPKRPRDDPHTDPVNDPCLDPCLDPPRVSSTCPPRSQQRFPAGRTPQVPLIGITVWGDMTYMRLDEGEPVRAVLRMAKFG